LRLVKVSRHILALDARTCPLCVTDLVERKRACLAGSTTISRHIVEEARRARLTLCFSCLAIGRLAVQTLRAGDSISRSSKGVQGARGAIKTASFRAVCACWTRHTFCSAEMTDGAMSGGRARSTKTKIVATFDFQASSTLHISQVGTGGGNRIDVLSLGRKKRCNYIC